MMTQACTFIFCGSDACWGNQQMHGTDISSISHQNQTCYKARAKCNCVSTSDKKIKVTIVVSVELVIQSTSWGKKRPALLKFVSFIIPSCWITRL